MKNKSLFLLAILFFLANLQLQAQEIKNKGKLQVYKNEFFEEIEKASKEFFDKKKKE